MQLLQLAVIPILTGSLGALILGTQNFTIVSVCLCAPFLLISTAAYHSDKFTRADIPLGVKPGALMFGTLSLGCLVTSFGGYFGTRALISAGKIAIGCGINYLSP